MRKSATANTKTESTRSSLLKILSGPHQGAEILLEPNGEFMTVGSDPEADLILNDALISPRHFRLENRDGILLVRPLEGRVFLDGKLAKEEEFTIAPFQFLTAGTTQMMVGPSDSPWPPLSVVDAPDLEKIIAETPEEMVIPKADFPSVEAGVSKGLAERTARNLKKRKSKRIMWFSLIVLALGLTILALLPKKEPFRIADMQKIIQAQIADMGYFNTLEVRLENGQIIIEGYVSTLLEARDLRNALTSIYPGIQFRVRSDEKIIQEIEETLGAIDGNVTVGVIQPGIYGIGGYIFNTEAWQKIRNRLARDIPGVKKIQDNVLSPERIMTSVNDLLAQYGLARNVTALPQMDRVLFRGEIGINQQESWRKVAEDFVQMFNELIPIEFDVKLSGKITQDQAKNPFFGSTVQGVTVSANGLSWITLQDGRKYFEGSFLPSGYTIQSIAVDGIEFAQNGKTVKIRIEELRQ